MSINIGDTIRFLHDVGGGVVVAKNEDGEVMIRMEDGFEIPVLCSDCVVVARAEVVEAPVIKNEVKVVAKKRDEFQHNLDRLKAAFTPSQSVVVTKTKKEKSVPVTNFLEVDLHIDNLLDSTSGMNSGDMLRYQLDEVRRTIKKYSHNRGMRIVFIHGNGDGVLRSAILSELRRMGMAHKATPASFSRYGHGALQVLV